MRFGVLGPLVVWDEAGQVVTVPEVKVRALLADLLAHDGGPVATDRLVDDLWGDQPPSRPTGALQSRVSQLRRVIGRDRVVRQPPGYALRLHGPEGPGTTDGVADEVDAARFEALVAEARQVREPGPRAARFAEALALWRGPAYADFADEEFVRPAAQRLTEQRLSAWEEQARARLAAGDHAAVAGELTDLVGRHPLRERMRALQMRALYGAGRQSEALASYEELRARLAEELGVDPSPELSELHQAVLRQDARLLPTPSPPGPAAPSASPATPSTPSAPHRHKPPRPAESSAEGSPADAVEPPLVGPGARLPAPLTSLIGRRQDLAEVGRLLDAARLVTLTGPGGVGKTRLAVAAAAEAAGDAERFPDGVWLVEFAGLRAATVEDLAQAVATAVGIRDDAALAPRDPRTPAPPRRLAAALRDRRALLVLDNCEHVVDAAAELVTLLLHTAPGLRVLATSQEPLGRTGESVFPVEPLPTADAVRLFRERAAARAPGFPVDPGPADSDDREAVEEICRRLDGLPLALELAATRVRALGVRELAARLGDRFRVLTSGQRGAPARQQTLRAVIDWSWELLSAPERIVLRRLAAFGGGCDLPAAEAVCAGDGVARDDVLDLVTRLVDRSLVVVVDAPTGRRYQLLESVAAYARERLADMADLDAVRERHLRHYRALAERAAPLLHGAEQQTWLARLDADADNLRRALDEATGPAAAPDTADDAARLAASLAWWWLLRGRLTEGRRGLRAARAARPVGTAGDDPVAAELTLLHAAFALLTGDRAVAVERSAAEAIPDPARRARALWLCAYGLFSAGATAESDELNTHTLALCAATGDRWGTAAALALRAMLALVRGDLAALSRDGLRGADLFRELGDRWGELQTVSPLAALAEIRGAYEEAARRQHEGLRMARELGLAAEVSARLSGLGRLALLARDWDRARDLHERARRGAAEQGYTYGVIHSEMGLALGARRAHDLDAAEAHLRHIGDGYAAVSSRAGDHLRLAELGFVAELRGDAALAATYHLRGLDIARSLDEPRALALSLEGLAGALARSADEPAATSAALLLGAADAARRSVGAPLPPAERGDVDRGTAAARATLGAPAFAAAFARGACLTTTDAAQRARAAADRLRGGGGGAASDSRER
ncbi:BTAD domain-containing putative transcriptional regulator [Streptomyces buecherae]|uniref:AfsR/SARP family transcriptional regulator n=1 Tax=Streptomyces buecherae TaxID=2763006 RepID=UPI003682B6E8